MAKRTKQQIISAIISELQGALEYTTDTDILVKTLSGRYHPDEIQQAILELNKKRGF